MLRLRRPLSLSVAICALTLPVACPAGESDAEGEGEGGEGEGEAVVDDRDLDGVTVAGGDCDDLNNTVNPTARERAHDGVDSNCDGEDLPVLGDNQFAAVLADIDADGDSAISFAEFAAACEASAMLDATVGRPGVVQTHASCAGTNACRGMILHPWGELFVHDCKGVNYCTGWSCTETAIDAGRSGQEAYEAVGCTNCHSGTDGAFKVEVPPGEDVDATVAAFFDRSDDRFRAAIAFGLRGISPGDVAYTNMPGHYEQLSLRELDAVISHVRTLPLEGAAFAYADGNEPVGTPEE